MLLTIYNEPMYKSPQYALVYDGARRNEDVSSNSISRTVIGKNFGEKKETGLVIY